MGYWLPPGRLFAVKVLVKAPAKINLALRVGTPRLDGYHRLDTVFTALDLADDVEAITADELTMSMSGRGEDLPVDESNLVIKAARALQKFARARGCEYLADRGAHIHVTKRIPVAGGMAGGSADAAGALVALNELWGIGASHSDLLRLAADLGSDVPFALVGGIAHGTGRGEQLVPVSVPQDLRQQWVVLVNPEGLSTPAVFRAFDEVAVSADNARIADTPASTGELRSALEQGDTAAIVSQMINDLEPVARHLRPDLQEIFDCLESVDGIEKVILSGSGPSIAILVGDADADRLATKLAEFFPNLDVVRTAGPARGAHIVASSTPEETN